ncbi:GIP, partial [Symbiodinium sp. CCMP2456]
MESSASTGEGAAEAPDVPMESSAPTGEDLAEVLEVPVESSAPTREDSPELSEIPMENAAQTSEAADALEVSPGALVVDLQWEVTLGPLWRLSARLLQDPATREAGLVLRQRFAYFANCPGAVETLLQLTPVLGEEEDGELVAGPLAEVSPGENRLGEIVEYIPMIRATVDVGTLTNDLIVQHGEAQERALTGLFLHATGITGADVRACVQNGNLSLFRRPYWRGRELLFQQIGAWLFRCLSSFETLRKRDLQWEGILHSTEMPTTLVAPDCAAGENHFILAELLRVSGPTPPGLRAAAGPCYCARRHGFGNPDCRDALGLGPGISRGSQKPSPKARPSIALLQEAQAKASALILLNRQVREAEQAERAAQEQEAFQWANRAPPPMPEPPTPSSIGSPASVPPAPSTPIEAFRRRIGVQGAFRLHRRLGHREKAIFVLLHRLRK